MRIKDRSLPAFPILRTVKLVGKGGKKEMWYQVDPREKNSTRKREHFQKKSDAFARVKEIAEEIRTEGRDAILTKEQQVEAAYCFNLMKPHNASLSRAVEFFVYEILMKDAINLERTVSKLADEWVKAKEVDKIDGEMSPRSIKDIKQARDRLKELFGFKPVSEITTGHIQAHLDGLKLSQQTKSKRRNLFAQFFNYCIRKTYIKENPATGKIIKVKVPKKEKITVLTVDEAEKLMRAAETESEGSMMPYFALALFAGIRPDGELRRLTWEDINEKRIFLKDEITKTKRWRAITPIPANLAAWLAKVPEKKRKGRIFPHPNGTFRARFDKIRTTAGLKEIWDEDITRHSFASYWLAENKDREALTEILGNSEKMLFDHYREFIEEEEAPKYWQILPKS